MTPKRIAIALLQTVVTGGILFWIFHKPETRAQMVEALSRADRSWLLFGIAIVGAGESATLYRWTLFLRLQKIQISRARTACIFLISMLFNLFLFGTAGGDLMKIVYLARENPRYIGPGFLSVLMDRLCAFPPLIAAALFFTLWNYSELSSTPIIAGSLWIMISFLTGLSLLLIGSFCVTGWNWLDRIPAKLPARNKIIELGEAYHAFAVAWKTTLIACGLSTLTMFSYFASFYCAAKAFHYDLPFFSFCSIMPIITVIVALPASISGLGVREKLFEEMLGTLFNVPSEVAILISLTGFLFYLLWSLTGIIPYFLYKPSGKQPVSLGEISNRLDHLHS